MQRDVRETGSEVETIKYLQSHDGVAILVFSLAVVISGLWLQTYIAFIKETVFRNKHVTWAHWAVISLGTTILIWILFRRALKVPITAAFTL